MIITVFLVHDHAVVRDGLRLILEAQGDIKVVGEAANGHNAVHRVAQLCPDVVVMDIAMPGPNGIEATRQIRETRPSARVVVLSMHSATEYIFQALRAGARGYLLKESAGDEAVSAVRIVQAGHRYLSQKISDKVIDDYVRHREVAEAENPLARLSPREREILQLVVDGRSSVEIAGLVKFAIVHELTPLE